jgi:hypothetical protein
MEVPMSTAFAAELEAPSPAAEPHGEVVEVALLLPRRRADALRDLAQRRRQSVGQILRALIEREVLAEA